MLKPLLVKEGINWVGSLDFDIRVFDIIMETENGTTYNSYVVQGSEKTALVEVCKEGFFDEFLERLKGVTDPASIDYVVLDHTEPDHTGSLHRLLDICPNATLVATNTALRFIKEILNKEAKSLAVKEGDTLELGGKTLTFIPAPLLHWPDTMFTYIPQDKVLFTCDSFGCHYASEEVFNDLIKGDFYDSYKYYFDAIMGPFKPSVQAGLKKIEGLEIEMILNGHGPVIRKDPEKYLEYYRQWSKPHKNEPPLAVVAYVTAYGYTRQLAESITSGIKSAGNIDVKVFDLVKDGDKEARATIEASDGFLLGSPTLVGEALPPILQILAWINPIIHKGKLAGAFGSFGWSGEAVPNLEARLKQLKFKVPVPGLRVQFKPTDAQLEEAVQYGAAFGKALLESRA
ncbi:MAG: FprA family A-type flavoprotein [Clostridiales bacterium]|jgi:flavorubredoxin|nr:FprA family A-type flavoprotein [Clostridiales bacterium]